MAPYHNWFSLLSTLNAGKANYQAFEVEVAAHGEGSLASDANYTFANNEADNQGDAPAAFAGEVNYGLPVADRFNVNGNYGNVAGTRHNRALLTAVYQLPFGEGRKFLTGGGWKNQVLGGRI